MADKRQVIVTLVRSDSENYRFQNDANLSAWLITWSAKRKCVLVIKKKVSVVTVHAM